MMNHVANVAAHVRAAFNPQSVPAPASLDHVPSLKEMGLSPMPPVWAEGVSPNEGARPVNDKVPGVWRTETRPDGKTIRIFTPASSAGKALRESRPDFDSESCFPELDGDADSNLLTRVMRAFAGGDPRSIQLLEDDVSRLRDGLCSALDVIEGLQLLDPDGKYTAVSRATIRRAQVFRMAALALSLMPLMAWITPGVPSRRRAAMPDLKPRAELASRVRLDPESYLSEQIEKGTALGQVLAAYAPKKPAPIPGAETSRPRPFVSDDVCTDGAQFHALQACLEACRSNVPELMAALGTRLDEFRSQVAALSDCLEELDRRRDADTEEAVPRRARAVDAARLMVALADLQAAIRIRRDEARRVSKEPEGGRHD